LLAAPATTSSRAVSREGSPTTEVRGSFVFPTTLQSFSLRSCHRREGLVAHAGQRDPAHHADRGRVAALTQIDIVEKQREPADQRDLPRGRLVEMMTI